jgi:hypothetical protein
MKRGKRKRGKYERKGKYKRIIDYKRVKVMQMGAMKAKKGARGVS